VLENKRLALRYDRLGFIVQALLQAACIFLVAGRLARGAMLADQPDLVPGQVPAVAELRALRRAHRQGRELGRERPPRGPWARVLRTG
jgi:hypothetical protein